MLDAGIPRRHIECFKTRIETPALLWSQDWGFRGFLLFMGASGVGKSFSAAWTVKRYLRDRIPDTLDIGTWDRASRACGNFVWGTANKLVQDKTVIVSARNACLLVIDALGREGDSATRQADVGDIVSARYDAKLPTIVTTDLTLNDIMSVYGGHTARKLLEDVLDGQNKKPDGMIIDCDKWGLKNAKDD
jgi:DNA replication protein DnaC